MEDALALPANTSAQPDGLANCVVTHAQVVGVHRAQLRHRRFWERCFVSDLDAELYGLLLNAKCYQGTPYAGGGWGWPKIHGHRAIFPRSGL